MSQNHTVAVIVGSLRKDSVNRLVAKAVEKLAPANLSFIEVAIDLPLYNPDVEDQAPDAWQAFRAAVKTADALLIVTPEYNRSMPGALKNAIDVGSRPYGASVWTGKPAAVISASPGSIGAFGANHHVRQSLAHMGAPAMPHEAYIAAAHTLFDEFGELTNEATRAFLTDFGAKFADWIDRNAVKA